MTSRTTYFAALPIACTAARNPQRGGDRERAGVNARRHTVTLATLAVCTLVLTGCSVPIAAPLASPPVVLEASEGVRTAPASEGREIFRTSVGVSLAGLLPVDLPKGDTAIGYVLTDVGGGARIIHGVYAEAGPMPFTWLTRDADGAGGVRVRMTGRGESLFPDAGVKGYGLTLTGRLGVELVSEVHGIAKSFHGWSGGNEGLGVFIEAGAQKLPGGERATIASAGLTMRLPATFGGFFWGWARVN